MIRAKKKNKIIKLISYSPSNVNFPQQQGFDWLRAQNEKFKLAQQQGFDLFRVPNEKVQLALIATSFR